MSISLIIGASGLVGNHLKQALEKHGETVVGTSVDDSSNNFILLDIQSGPAVDQLVQRIRPTVVYVAAALTNVDYCEQHPDESYAVNVLGIRHVVQAARRVGALVVFFSSDYIFDGTSGPYSEDDPPRPLSIYGQHKILGELLVSQQATRFIIIRTTVVFGTEHEGKNFIYRLHQTLTSKQTLLVPVDQVGTPTYAPNMAAIVIALVAKGAKGVYNIVGPTVVDRFVFAREAAAVFGLDATLIRPVKTIELGQAAKRPLKGGLRIKKVSSIVDIPSLDYKKGLQALAHELLPWKV